MKSVSIQGKKIIVDDEDLRILKDYKWTMLKTGYLCRCVKVDHRKYECRLFHRMIMNAPKGMQVDHINCNPLDNRRSNLRICTSKQNSMNRKHLVGRKYKGVYRAIRPWGLKKEWVSRLHHQGKMLHLGYFSSEIEAAKAFNEKAIKLRGSFAVLNSIPS